MAKTNKDKDRLLRCLKDSMGIITTACEAAKCSRYYYYKLIEEDPEFKKEVEQIAESAIDMAELSLLKQIKSGNTTATLFYLKTKGRERGYIEKVHNVNENLNYNNMTDEDLDKRIKELE